MPKALKDHQKNTDLLIGGAGFAGLALAIALRQGLGEAFAVTVADPTLAATPSKDPRASAIAAAARRLFEAIDVWDAVAGDAQLGNRTMNCKASYVSRFGDFDHAFARITVTHGRGAPANDNGCISASK